MEKPKVRVRFAPSPTGMMHLGNVRTALMNYLFAKQKAGTFVLRIEDTDPERNFDPEAKHIIKDLDWLGLTYDEGPEKTGPFAPYFQSKRMNIYQEKLDQLIKHKKIYRCFCTEEELDKKRQRQIALKRPPRYDKTCLKLTEEEIQQRLDAGAPFIWRVKLDKEKTITIKDLSHGAITFELKNFSDFPITRKNGTFTFMFANFVDDMIMQMTHILRGEDHLTNTAGQAVLYQAFDAHLPLFWHLPILCNLDGKKLSKRDFGFSLKDLKEAGFLPEAICDYLAIIGGSFEDEIMSLQELTKKLNFDHPQAKGQIKYDAEKLKWVNRKWIAKYDPERLYALCLPYLQKAYDNVDTIKKEKLIDVIQHIKTDLVTLNDITKALAFFFQAPTLDKSKIIAVADENKVSNVTSILEKNIKIIDNTKQFITNLKEEGKKENITPKEMFSLIRIGLTGSAKGPGINELIEILGTSETKKRIVTLLGTIKQ